MLGEKCERAAEVMLVASRSEQVKHMRNVHVYVSEHGIVQVAHVSVCVSRFVVRRASSPPGKEEKEEQEEQRTRTQTWRGDEKLE